MDECWGLHCRKDPLQDRLEQFFYENNLMDIMPSPMSPTWHNGRSREHHIGKRLDHFLVHENILERLGFLHSSVQQTYISYHLPIILQWISESVQPIIPFKFNRIWPEDENFNALVNSTWNSMELMPG